MKRLGKEEMERAFLEYLAKEGRPISTSKIGDDLRPILSPASTDSLMSQRRLNLNWAGTILQRLRKRGLVRCQHSGRVGTPAMWSIVPRPRWSEVREEQGREVKVVMGADPPRFVLYRTGPKKVPTMWTLFDGATRSQHFLRGADWESAQAAAEVRIEKSLGGSR